MDLDQPNGTQRCIINDAVHRRRSGWNSEGDAWWAPEVGRCRMRWGMGKGVPLGGLGERRELPQRGPGRAPAENGFWRILKATEWSFLYLYDKNLRGTICISVPYSKFCVGLVPRVPRDLRPWCSSNSAHICMCCHYHCFIHFFIRCLFLLL